MQQGTETNKGCVFCRPVPMLRHWRPFPPYELLCYILMFAAAFMFAYGIQPYSLESLRLLLLTIATLYCGFFAALIWNDITDKDIDAIVHPYRIIPSGRISPAKFFSVALLFSALTFLFAILISPWCLILVGVTALFVALHNKFLKKIIQFPAYSEIFTPAQWLTVPLLGFFAIWTALPAAGDITFTVPVLGYLSIRSSQLISMLLLVLFTYFADDAHDIAEGIHDSEGDRRHRVKTYATSFGEKNAAKISFGMFFFSGILGVLLWHLSILSFLFLIPFLFLWIWICNSSYQLIKTTDINQRKNIAKTIGKKGYDYLLFTYAFIFIDLLLQLLNAQYLHWIVV